MPASSLYDSIGVAKRIQLSMAKLTAALPDVIREGLTCSFGLATYQNLPPMNAETFFKEADAELYNAKKEGKNRISYGRVSKPDMTAISAEEKAALAQPLSDNQRETG
ncbi:MAG: diguanylate cyclase [Syntrophales bacterium LBB04]|nr:diguanylate cyclase [Syntrophales bacterium LBB04]